MFTGNEPVFIERIDCAGLYKTLQDISRGSELALCRRMALQTGCIRIRRGKKNANSGYGTLHFGALSNSFTVVLALAKSIWPA